MIIKYPFIVMITLLCIFASSACIKSRIGNMELYEKVIEAINNGELKQDQTEEVTLPPRLSQASIDGKIYLKRTPKKIIVIFKAWIGKGQNFEGYMYTSSSFSESEMQKDNDGNNTINIASMDIVIGKIINDHWYSVNYSLD